MYSWHFFLSTLLSFKDKLVQLIIQLGVVALHDKVSDNEQSVWSTKSLPARKLLSQGSCIGRKPYWVTAAEINTSLQP